MSPEQAKGRAVDKRSRRLGVRLRALRDAHRPACFEGDDVSDTLAAILRADPDWSAMPAMAPPAIRRLLRRSLQKDPRSRLSDMAMARIELNDAEAEGRTGATDAPIVRSTRLSAVRHLAPYAAAVVLAVATGLAVWILSRPEESPRAVVRFSIDLGDQTQLSAIGRDVVALSPDGTRLVYVANQRLYVRALDRLDGEPITGTEAGGSAGFARAPFFSLDGRWIAFWQQNQLRKVSTTGGAPTTICDVQPIPMGASWETRRDRRRDWRKAVSRGCEESAEIRRRSSDPETGRILQGPQMLPGGEWLLYTGA